MYLLDTNVCIDFLGGRSAPLAHRMDAMFGRLAISSITAAELLVGNRSSLDPVADARRVDIFVASVDVTDFLLRTRVSTGRLFAVSACVARASIA